MVGAIRSWDILSHPVVTIQCFGWRIFFRAVFGGRRQTFLSTLHKAGFFQSAATETPDCLERCIQLEFRAMRLYRLLAHRFADSTLISGFLHGLAQQEQEHGELLELCRAAEGVRRWQAEPAQPWHNDVPRLEEQMQQVLGSINEIHSVDDLVQLIVQLESSELNGIMEKILRASNSAFVRKLAPFQSALEDHIDFICRQIPEFAPRAMAACRELRVKFARHE